MTPAVERRASVSGRSVRAAPRRPRERPGRARARSPARPASSSPKRARAAAASASASPGATSAVGADELGQRADRGGHHRHARGHRLGRGQPKVSAEREGTIASAARARSVGQLVRPTRARRSARRRPARSAVGLRAVAGHDERQARARARLRPRRRRPSPAPAARRRARARRPPPASRSANARTTWGTTCDARRIERRAQLAQALRRERARHDDRVGLRRQPPLPQRQRGGVGGRLGAGAAAVQPHARQRVAAVAARAVLAAALKHVPTAHTSR